MTYVLSFRFVNFARTISTMVPCRLLLAFAATAHVCVGSMSADPSFSSIPRPPPLPPRPNQAVFPSISSTICCDILNLDHDPLQKLPAEASQSFPHLTSSLYDIRAVIEGCMEHAPSSNDAMLTVAPPAVVSSWMQPMKKPSTVGSIAWLSPLVEKVCRSTEKYAAALWERQGCTTIPWNDKPLALLLRIVLIAMLWTLIAMSQR